MKLETRRMERNAFDAMMDHDKIKSVIMIDGQRRMDRQAMRELIKSHDIELNNPRSPLLVFKLSGNLIGCDDDE